METLARVVGPRGEIALRRRVEDHQDIDELVVNGAFVMDSRETSSERHLARLSMVDAGAGATERRRILVGGLGLGFTAAEVVELAERTGIAIELDVVEIEGCLIDWARSGLTPTLGRVASHPRVRLTEGDVGDILASPTPVGAGPSGPWDAIVLDVDNGPDFLIHPENAALYTPAGLARAYAQLSPGGILAIWCQGLAPELEDALRHVSHQVDVQLIPVQRGDRRFSYPIYSVRAEPEAG